jgi:hypothetical protein
MRLGAQKLEHEVLGMSSTAGGATSLLIDEKIQSPDSGASLLSQVKASIMTRSDEPAL